MARIVKCLGCGEDIMVNAPYEGEIKCSKYRTAMKVIVPLIGFIRVKRVYPTLEELSDVLDKLN